MNVIKIIILSSISLFIFTGCISQQDPELMNKKPKVDYLLETKDINNITKLEVSNNLIQILPVISISGVQILLDENTIDEKQMFFRNKKCIFQGIASADLSTKRVKVNLQKATCRTKQDHKVNYQINGWVLGEDEIFGLKATKEVILEKIDLEEEKYKERVILKVAQGEYSYISLDMVKQLETILIKDQKPKTNIKSMDTQMEKQKMRLLK